VRFHHAIAIADSMTASNVSHSPNVKGGSRANPKKRAPHPGREALMMMRIKKVLLAGGSEEKLNTCVHDIEFVVGIIAK
jgi:hypothetical protein